MAQRFRKRSRVTSGPHDNAQGVPIERVLLIWHVALRCGVAGGAALVDVTNDTNDGHTGEGIKGAVDRSPDGVLASKRFLNQGFIHDGDKRFVTSVAIIEVASVLQWNSESRKRTGSHDVFQCKRGVRKLVRS